METIENGKFTDAFRSGKFDSMLVPTSVWDLIIKRFPAVPVRSGPWQGDYMRICGITIRHNRFLPGDLVVGFRSEQVVGPIWLGDRKKIE